MPVPQSSGAQGLDCANELPANALPTDADTAVMAAIANARARVILANIVILLVAKPKAASADWIAQCGFYSRGGIRMGFAKCIVCVCFVRCAVVCFGNFPVSTNERRTMAVHPSSSAHLRPKSPNAKFISLVAYELSSPGRKNVQLFCEAGDSHHNHLSLEYLDGITARDGLPRNREQGCRKRRGRAHHDSKIEESGFEKPGIIFPIPTLASVSHWLQRRLAMNSDHTTDPVSADARS
jgi:hypothetical protein